MLIDQFYPVVGGAEQQALRLSLKLIRKGHRVIVLTRRSREDLRDTENLDGLTIHRLSATGVSGASKLKSTLPAARWLIRHRHDYDLVHCHGVNPLEWSAMLAGLITKKPYVLKIPLSNFLNYAGAKDGFIMPASGKVSFFSRITRLLFILPILKFVRKNLIRRAGRVLAISPEIKDTLNKNGLKNISDLPNGIDTDFFAPATPDEKAALRNRLGLSTETVVFVYSGRLAVEKNLTTLLTAWNHYRRRSGYVESKLILLGTGRGQYYSTEKELRQMASDYILNDVIFAGAVDNVIDYLRAADVFILPSLWEGMSNALLEAMACGLPAIASDIPGNRALVEHEKSGLLFDPGSPKILADCLECLAGEPLFRAALGKRAREITEEKFSLQKITERLLDEYQKLLA